MVRKLFSLAIPAALAAAVSFPQAAQATWLSLADGQYAVDLNCTTSSTIACPSTIHGSLTIQGSQATAFDFVVNSQVFQGDPVEGSFSNSIVAFEDSFQNLTPFSFLSLRYITSGSIGSFGTGDLWWVYCSNQSSSTCSPNTQGLWSATRINGVPEPESLALLAAAWTAAAMLTRRRRRARS